MTDDPSLERFGQLARLDDRRIQLAEAALEVARIGHPDLDPRPSLAALDELVRRLEERRWDAEPSTGQAGLMCRVLFQEMGFRGNRQDYYDPRNSYLNDVLTRRIGIPITLAVVFLEVARRLGVNAEGVGFPGHFLVRCRDRGHGRLLDPFAGGKVVSREDCQTMLDRSLGVGVALDARFLEPVGPRYILGRMLRNLKAIYLSRKDLHRARAALDRLVLLEPGDLQERRDRGKVRLSLGDSLGAARDLETYFLEARGEGDTDEVRELVQSIRKQQAMAN